MGLIKLAYNDYIFDNKTNSKLKNINNEIEILKKQYNEEKSKHFPIIGHYKAHKKFGNALKLAKNNYNEIYNNASDSVWDSFNNRHPNRPFSI